MFGWRASFIAVALLTLVGALIVTLALPRERSFVRSGGLRDSARQMLAHLRNPRLLAIYAVGFGVLFNFIATFTYVSFHLAEAPYFFSPTLLGALFATYLAGSFVDLAKQKNIPVTDELLRRVDDAVAEQNSTMHAATSFASGLVTGNADDVASMSGTVAGAMVGVHALIGIGEGVITGLVVSAVLATRPDLVHGAAHLVPVLDLRGETTLRPVPEGAA